MTVVCFLVSHEPPTRTPRAARTPSALVIGCVIRIRQTVKFQCITTTLPTKKADPHQVFQECISLLGVIVLQFSTLGVLIPRISPNQFRIARADRPKSDKAAVQRVTGTSQFSLESSCPHCVGRSLLLPLEPGVTATLGATKVEFVHKFSHRVLGRPSKSRRPCCR